MKKRSPLNLRQFLFLIALLVSFSALTIFLFTYNQDEKRFLNITSRLFAEEMTASTLNMHYTLANPEDFGIYEYTPILPGYDRDGSLKSQAALENTLRALQAIDPEHLCAQDAWLCKLLTRYLENALTLQGFTLYGEPLSPSSGMQSQLPILLAEYTFRNERDVKDYLALLDQTDEYFASLLRYEQDKAAAGHRMPASSLRSVREQCDTIVTLEELDAGTHFLQTTFRERLDLLCQSGLLTEEQARKYEETNDRLLRTVMLPAYVALGDGLLILEDVTVPMEGLAARPRGKEYYQALLISETGSYRPVEEIQELLTARFTAEYDALRALLEKHPEAASLYGTGTLPSFPLSEPDRILSDLEGRMTGNFPAIPGEYTAVTVKPVCDSLEKYCAPAFYLTAPLDDTSRNVIYVNRRKTLDSLELYTTLAHEGYPGHLYQTVYNNRRSLAAGEKPARELLWYGGYLEGWALYVEFISYDYASSLLQEQNQSEYAVLTQIEKHNRSLQLCLYSLLDIMIHYEGASYGHIAQVLEGFGITEDADCRAIYDYIAQEPCNYLKYYLGYLEILALREEAITLWGEEYTDYRFHCFFLDNGPADFLSLNELLHSSSMSSK